MLRRVDTCGQLDRVLIIEEIRRLDGTECTHRVLPKLFQRRLTSRDGNCLVALDDSIESHVQKMHVIFPSPCQFYCATHLETNPHYTVRDGEELSSLVRAAISKGVTVAYYRNDSDHLDGDCVRVLNDADKGKLGDEINAIPWVSIVDCLRSMRPLDELRGSYTSHIGFSSTLGQGWHKPYPTLDMYAGEHGLNKPGITSSMPTALLSTMGRALWCCAALAKKCWGEPNVNPDVERQREFSDLLRDCLQFAADVTFEAGTIAMMRGSTQQLSVHTDTNNDGSFGYEKTGVLIMHLADENEEVYRVTAIGYNRKCCRDFMNRLRLARVNQKKSLLIGNWLHSLDIQKQRQLRIIEAAAVVWLSDDEGRRTRDVIQKGMYTEDELMTARNVVNTVKRRGLKATQEERPQINHLVLLVRRLFASGAEVVTNIAPICRALTFLIHAHAKNHRLDGISVLNDIRHQQHFQELFLSYESTMTVLPPPATTGTWIDVYGEYTYNKLFSTLDPVAANTRLNKFATQMRIGMDVEEAVVLLSKYHVFILGGKLFQIMAVVMLKELGVVAADEAYDAYLPRVFTKTSGSVKVLQQQAGMADPGVCKEYIKHFAKSSGISAITYENILCKFKVAYYS